VENFKRGDKVIYIGCTQEQINWGSNDDPRKILFEDYVYCVETVNVRYQHTKLTLKGVYGNFNSVCFKKI
jgi:hypothetical protein